MGHLVPVEKATKHGREMCGMLLYPVTVVLAMHADASVVKQTRQGMMNTHQ